MAIYALYSTPPYGVTSVIGLAPDFSTSGMIHNQGNWHLNIDLVLECSAIFFLGVLITKIMLEKTRAV